MNFYVETLFPEQVRGFLNESITGRAIEKGIISLDCVNIRDFAVNDYGKVDDTMYVVGSAVDAAANVMKGRFKAFDYYVPEFDQYLLYLYCDVFAGMSGSGVYTDSGFFCGLVAGGSDEGETVVIPLTDILESLEKIN